MAKVYLAFAILMLSGLVGWAAPTTLEISSISDGKVFATLAALRMDQDFTIRVADGRLGPVYWYQLLPQPLDYDNTESCAPNFTPGCNVSIQYTVEEIVVWRDMTQVDSPQVVETLGLGTHLLRAYRAPMSDDTIESRELSDVFILSLRKDDTYVGHLSGMLGVPFVYYPTRMSGGRHQTDARLGADCIALVVSGRRNLGESIPYMGPSRLPRYADEVLPRKDGQQPIRVGDVLHFGFQTAVVVEDRPPLGILSDEDVIIHSYHTLVEYRRYADLPYRAVSHRVYRWRETRN